MVHILLVRVLLIDFLLSPTQKIILSIVAATYCLPSSFVSLGHEERSRVLLEEHAASSGKFEEGKVSCELSQLEELDVSDCKI